MGYSGLDADVAFGQLMTQLGHQRRFRKFQVQPKDLPISFQAL